jgi:hypothetical protein
MLSFLLLLPATPAVGDAAAAAAAPSNVQIESALQELSAKIERSAAAVAAKVGEGEASVHKQAKADHAKTCQVRRVRQYHRQPK